MKFFRFRPKAALFSTHAAVLNAELVAAADLTNWMPGAYTGVIGGILINRTILVDVTQPPYITDSRRGTP